MPIPLIAPGRRTVRPANVRMQFKILARTTDCNQQKKLFPTFNSTRNPTHKMRCLVRLARRLLIRCRT
jgi:hypothetical protein